MPTNIRDSLSTAAGSRAGTAVRREAAGAAGFAELLGPARDAPGAGRPFRVSEAGRIAPSRIERVGAAIHHAAARTGVDFGYLMGQARVESGLDPDAKAKTSSATGLFQFIEQTWLGTVEKHGAKHGLGWAADAIRRGPGGRYQVADPAARRAILDLRRDPGAASTMAAEFAADNRSHLEASLGRKAEPVDLYLAHFLGAGGAARFLKAHDGNPDAAAAAALPAAARANRWVFYDRGGAPRSYAEIRERFAAKLGASGGDRPRGGPGALPADLPEVRMAVLERPAPAPAAGPAPHYARLAYLMLAQLDA